MRHIRWDDETLTAAPADSGTYLPFGPEHPDMVLCTTCGHPSGDPACKCVAAVVTPVDLDGIDLDASSLVISDLATAWWTAGARQLESPAEEGDREYAARWVKAVVRKALGIKDGGGV